MFQPGDQLVVVKSLQTMSTDSLRLTPGLKGKVVIVDDQGDMLVDLTAFERLQWISNNDAGGFLKDTMPAKYEKEVSGTTAELQRLLAENNVSLLRALQDIRSEVKSGVAQKAEDISAGLTGMLRETNEQMTLQNELIAGLARSVGELRASVAPGQQEEQGSLATGGICRLPSLDERTPQLSETPKLTDSGGLLQRKRVQISAPSHAIWEHAPKVDAVPLVEDVRMDFMALLQGMRENNKLTVDQAAKELNDLREEVRRMRLPELLNTLDARRRQDDEQAFLAMIQALRESKKETVNSVRESLAEMQAAASGRRTSPSTVTSQEAAEATAGSTVLEAGTSGEGRGASAAELQPESAEAVQVQLARVLSAVSELLGQLADHRRHDAEACLAMLRALYENREEVVRSFQTAVGEIQTLSNVMSKNGSQGVRSELSEIRESGRKALATLLP